ncbi:MAG: hypothetical protein Ct9H300mP1_36740 [Planctomycetaceae bacterium]|nr:MAG: hypothetical protein Ct9H300mP1_36740 [Planctomycetaceae bacterium]
MRIAAKINDSKLNRVDVGNAVRIVLDIDPDLPLEGELAEVNPFPFPRRWHGAPIEYGAKIRVKNPPKSLRPGQRAKVHIFVVSQAERSASTDPVGRRTRRQILLPGQAG